MFHLRYDRVVRIAVDVKMARQTLPQVRKSLNSSTQLEVWLVENEVRRLAQNVNIDMPEVGIFDNPSPNAFATGWNKNKALVAGIDRATTNDEQRRSRSGTCP